MIWKMSAVEREPRALAAPVAHKHPQAVNLDKTPAICATSVGRRVNIAESVITPGDVIAAGVTERAGREDLERKMSAPCSLHSGRGSKVANSLIVFLLMSLTVTPLTAETQERNSESLEVLKKFSGAWQTRTRIRQEGSPPREFNTRGKATCRQILEGRYFEFRAQSIPAGRAELQLMTYDGEAGVYRQWVFDSDGYRHEAEGQWDPSSSTLQWRGKTADTSFIIEDRWISPDRLDWTLVRTDAEGRRSQMIEGTLIRVRDGSRVREEE